MTSLRFSFQADEVRKTNGLVLNVGSYDDPAGLKSLAPRRVLNCDIEKHNNVDVIMDVRKRWPFKANYAELIVMGDILEHLYPAEAIQALTEAHRVSQKLCLTVPEDNRWETDGVAENELGARTHCTTWDEEHFQCFWKKQIGK